MKPVIRLWVYTTQTEILYEGDSGQLHSYYFHTPLPATLPANARKFLDRLSAEYGLPVRRVETRPNGPRAGIQHSIFYVGNLEDGLAEVGDPVSDDRVKADRPPVLCSCREPVEALSPRGDVFVVDCVDTQRPDEMEARIQHALKLAETYEHTLLKWIEHDKWYQVAPDRHQYVD